MGFKATAAANTGALNGTANASSGLITGNGTATSALKFVGTEDIGGGLKASFLAEFNPNFWQSSVADTNGTFAGTFNGTPFNGEQYVGLAGGFGDVKLGVPNAGFFLAENMSHPFGTAMGSMYGSSGASRLGTVAPGVVSGIASGTARIIRHERTVQYSTPNLNGFVATVDYAAKNDNSNSQASNTDGYSSITLRYSNGPLNIGYSNAVSTIGANGVLLLAATAPGTSSTANQDGNYTYNVLSANYNMGATTLYAGYTTTKSSGNVAAEDATSYNVAFKYTMGATDLLGNYTVRTSNLNPATATAYNSSTVVGSLANNAKMLGLGVDYNLSKRTALYARYELADVNTDGKVGVAVSSATAASVTGGSVTTATMVGIRHAF